MSGVQVNPKVRYHGQFLGINIYTNTDVALNDLEVRQDGKLVMRFVGFFDPPENPSVGVSLLEERP